MEQNPLRQFFRRPSIYIKLPSGGRFYGPDIYEPTENGEIPIYPMSAIDEITSKTPDAVFSGQAVVDIIQSCVPNIKNAWKLNVIDMETIIIAIRIASSGEELDITSTCPACENEADYGVNLVQIMSNQGDINYEETLKLRDLEIKFKPLTYKETNNNNLAQYELRKIAAIWEASEATQTTEDVKEAVQKLNQLMTDIIASTVEYIKTPEVTVTNQEFIREFLENCDRQTNKAIKEKSMELKTRNDLKPMRLKCTNCNHEYDQELMLNITNFFG
jgi:hypothetical protein